MSILLFSIIIIIIIIIITNAVPCISSRQMLPSANDAAEEVMLNPLEAAIPDPILIGPFFPR